MARTSQTPQLAPVNRSVWGLAEEPGPITGSALVEFDFGLPPAPVTNVPLREGEDPHGKVKSLDVAQAQLDHFFRTGEVRALCEGVCDPE